MALAEDFQRVVDGLPPDWTQLELDLRIDDEDRYIEAATLLTQINAMPYSKHDWHFRLRAANRFGHAAAHQTVAGTLALLDDQGIEGELVAREARSGRVEVAPDVGPARVRPPGVAPPLVAVAGMARIALLCPDLLFGSKVEGGAGRGGAHRQPLRRRGAVRTATSFTTCWWWI